jgi:hypothetical protein
MRYVDLALQLKTAVRKKAKLKIGIAAPSGAGKTMSSLLLAYGIVKGEHPKWSDEDCWSKIAIIDSENGSGELYAGYDQKGIKIGNYQSVTLSPPYTPQQYIEAIKLCKEAEMECAIIDSASHLWMAVLDKQGNIAAKTGNSYTSWREPSKEHSEFVDCMLQTDMHIIATLRSKTAYEISKDERGKNSVQKLGLSPVARDGFIYEFTLFFDIDETHIAGATKDRTGIFDGQFLKIDSDTGKKLAAWLDGAAPEDTVQKVVLEKANPVNAPEASNIVPEITEAFKQKVDAGKSKDEIYDLIAKINGGSKRYDTVKDVAKLKEILEAVQNY